MHRANSLVSLVVRHLSYTEAITDLGCNTDGKGSMLRCVWAHVLVFTNERKKLSLVSPLNIKTRIGASAFCDKNA